MNKELKNYGYIPSQISTDHYIFGASPVPFVIRTEDGDWSDSRPSKEIQAKKFDTFNCTGFNTLAQIEAYMKKVYGLDVNYSDRWLGIIAGTKPPGNNPHTVCEAIRKYGLIPEEMLPYNDDLNDVDEYYSFKGADESACREAGKKWLEQWDFLHDWVPENAIPVAIKTSPISRAVSAWFEKDGVYVRFGNDNHWTFQYKQSEYAEIEDSYEPTLKKVNQDLFYAKRIYIGKRDSVKKANWFQKFIYLISKLWK